MGLNKNFLKQLCLEISHHFFLQVYMYNGFLKAELGQDREGEVGLNFGHFGGLHGQNEWVPKPI